MAESAYRAGYSVVSLDGFADVDTLRTCKESWCIPLVDAEFPEHKIHSCLNTLYARYPNANLLLGAGAEIYTKLVESFVGWCLQANSSICVNQIYNPRTFFKSLDKLTIPYPQISWQQPEKEDEIAWLHKTAYRSGGTGVHRSCEVTINTGAYWQQESKGISISALCLTDKNNWRLIGVNRQFTLALSDHLPYVYAGAIANFEIDEQFKNKLISYAEYIIKHFKMVGLISIDMLLTADNLYVLEVNPRISASYELYERLATNVNLIDEHIRVCEGERLLQGQPITGQSGYLIVYAKSDFQVPEQILWPSWVHDRPEAKRFIRRHEPICSVYADATEANDLETLIRAREQEVLIKLKQ